MKSNVITDGVCDTIQELIPDYAFGLTDPGETRLVETNLTRCPEAAMQLADYRHLQAEMRAGVPQIAPPSQLETRLMAAVSIPAVIKTNSQARRVIRFSRLNRRWGWLAAALVLIALVGSNVYWAGRVNELTRQQNELIAQFTSQQQNKNA